MKTLTRGSRDVSRMAQAQVLTPGTWLLSQPLRWRAWPSAHICGFMARWTGFQNHALWGSSLATGQPSWLRMMGISGGFVNHLGRLVSESQTISHWDAKAKQVLEAKTQEMTKAKTSHRKACSKVQK